MFGKVYCIGDTKKRLETRLKEHKEACIKYHTDKSLIAEHACSEEHPSTGGVLRFYSALATPWSW